MPQAPQETHQEKEEQTTRQVKQAQVQKPPLPQKAGLKKASKSHSTTIKSKHNITIFP